MWHVLFFAQLLIGFALMRYSEILGGLVLLSMLLYEDKLGGVSEDHFLGCLGMLAALGVLTTILGAIFHFF